MSKPCESDDYEAIMQQESRERLVLKANLPLRHRGFNIKTATDSAWLTKYNLIREQLKTGVLMACVGPRGTGKTQMAVELARASCMMNRPATYCKVLEIFFDVRGTYRSATHGTSELQALAKYIDPKMLVIDEAHERGESAFEDRILTYLIDKRYDAEADTILVSNLTKDDFLTAIGPSIASRLQETGGIIVCDWTSYR